MTAYQSDLSFRTLDGGVLVGFYCVPKKGSQVFSPDRYAIDLTTGRARKATQDEWENAEPYITYRDSTLKAGIPMNPEDRLVYRGKEFRRTGANWPQLSEGVARLSQDGSFLAVNSWDGYAGGGEDLGNIGGPGPKGNYYVDVYDTNSGARLFSLSGHFRDADPYYLAWRSAWISKRYYFLPLDVEHMNRFVFCDIDKASIAPQGRPK